MSESPKTGSRKHMPFPYTAFACAAFAYAAFLFAAVWYLLWKTELLLQHWHPVVSQVPRHLQHDQAELHPTVRAPFLPVLRVTLLLGKFPQLETLPLCKNAAVFPHYTLSLALHTFGFILIESTGQFPHCCALLAPKVMLHMLMHTPRLCMSCNMTTNEACTSGLESKSAYTVA